MPEITNQKPLPSYCYCEECGANLIHNELIYSDTIRSNRWGRASFNYAGYSDVDINDEDIDETTDEEYQCEHCEHNITGSFRSIENMCETIRSYLRINEIQYRNEDGAVRDMPIFKDYALPNGERIVGFSHIVLPHIINLLREGEISNFNYSHQIYSGVTIPADAETNSEPIVVEVEPEMNEAVFSDGNHRRWGNGINYPNNTIECPACNFMFIGENEDCQCPRCKHTITNEPITLDVGATLRFHVNNTRNQF